MRREAHFIAAANSFEDFFTRNEALPNGPKGSNFELLIRQYLKTAPEYRSILSDVWLRLEVPSEIHDELGLPGTKGDEGVDLIARTREGEYWAIQAKFVGKRDQAPTREILGTFLSYTFHTCAGKFALGVIVHTSTKPIRKRHMMPNVVEIGLDRWRALDDENGLGWTLITKGLQGKTVRPAIRDPRRDQKEALKAAKEHFTRNTRGRAILPCGTGKSLLAYWIAQQLKAKTIVIAVPSLQLIKQSLADWTREHLAKDKLLTTKWLCVCSDEDVSNLEKDEYVGEVFELALPTFTNPKKIATRLTDNGPKIIFTTYHSCNKVVEAAKLAGVTFDLVIFDEAHRTAGHRDKSFATMLHDDFKVRRRLFMTATERVFNGTDGADEIFSMDDNNVYGKCFYRMTFKQAIDLKIITDYRILTVTVTEDEIVRLIRKNKLLNLNPDMTAVAEARTVATGIALKDTIRRHDIKKAVSFHCSIKAADNFRKQQDALNCLSPKTTNYHISSKQTMGVRDDFMRKFKASISPAVMTNARCLNEGINLPAIDCVVFADPKQSATDIIQAAGRAMRTAEGKELGYILLPLIVPEKMEFEEFAKTSAFREVVRIITALSIDDRIVDEFRAIQNGRISKGTIVEIEGKYVPVGMRMSLDKFADAIATRIWRNVGRVNWRPFEEARAFARSLGLKSQKEWNAYCRSGKKPADIPSNPEKIYAKWAGSVDWLGAGKRIGRWRDFEEARAFVRSLGLKQWGEWKAYCKSEEKPDDIPTKPETVYADTGWAGYHDWLGSGKRRPKNYRPFEEARGFARSLGFKTKQEWADFCKSGKNPYDIPGKPSRVYAAEWVSWLDWLGAGRRMSGWLPFEKAREFARTLGLKNLKEWQAYVKSGKKPDDIPSMPPATYADAGWISWGDWLGTGRRKVVFARKSRRGGWRSFKEARAFARSLGLKGRDGWMDYCRSPDVPDDIPTSPNRVYDSNWVGWSDWVGTA
jgi:superfamily II DNA or RNA helicase